MYIACTNHKPLRKERLKNSTVVLCIQLAPMRNHLGNNKLISLVYTASSCSETIQRKYKVHSLLIQTVSDLFVLNFKEMGS